MQPTALINETYLQLVGKNHPDCEDRVHFFGIAAFHMRQILAAHARKRLTEKRGGGVEAIPLDPSRRYRSQSTTMWTPSLEGRLYSGAA